MHNAIIMITAGVKHILQPVTEWHFCVGVMRTYEMQNQEYPEQTVREIRKSKSPVGKGEQDGISNHQQILKQPVTPAEWFNCGQKPCYQQAKNQALKKII